MRIASTTRLRSGILYITALVLVAGYPLTAMADAQETVTETPAVSKQVQQPAAEVTEPKPVPLTYTFDPVNEKWNSKDWQYNPQSGAYEKPPAPVIIESDTKSVEKKADTTVKVETNMDSVAASGSALVSGNTNAAHAISGDASAVATVINSVNSSIASSDNQKVQTFTHDIMGDVKGDIVLYPLLLKAMLEKQAAGSTSTALAANTNFDVNNTVNVLATSGDARVANNTTAGGATTGSATAMANVVNILNSMIASQDSFIGTVNIYGSLEGDILIAPDFIPQMLANNGDKSEGDSSGKLSTSDTTTIVNNISAAAKSGGASVFGNTTAGDAKTGNANTNVVIFNVTGHDIVAENSMLVFVNVLGRWVGMIVDAPEGATAGMIGSGVIKNAQHEPDLTLTAKSEHGITNTVIVNAETGDAVVSNNTTAGNATSGHANAMANIANVSGSQLSLSGWFGIWFINITGDWFGSFAVDTPYGNMPLQTQQPSGPVQFIPKSSKTTRQVKNVQVQRTVVDSRGGDATNSTATIVANRVVVASADATDVQGLSTINDVESSRPSVPVSDYKAQTLLAVFFFILAGASAYGLWRAA